MAALQQLATLRLVCRETSDGSCVIHPSVPLGKIYAVDLADTAIDQMVGVDGVSRPRQLVRCVDGSWMPTELLSGGNA